MYFGGFRAYRYDCPAVRIRVPRLFVYLEAALGGEQSYEGGYLARQVVDFVGVLSRVVAAPKQRIVVERLIFQHFDSFATTRVAFALLRNTVQLCYLVLKRRAVSKDLQTGFRAIRDLPLPRSVAGLYG